MGLSLFIGILAGLLLWYKELQLVSARKEYSQSKERCEREIEGLRTALEEERVQKKVLALQLLSQEELVRKTEALIETTKKNMLDRFVTSSHEAFFESQKTFLDMAKQTFEQYVTNLSTHAQQHNQNVSSVIEPLKVALGNMEAQVKELELARSHAYGNVTQQLVSLASSQTVLQKETSNLVKALSEPTVRGRWGEVQLRRVVELAGMVPYCDFEEQVHVHQEHGSIRPDMVIRLPNDRVIVIDSKVSLGAYLAAVAAENKEERENGLLQHAKHVRKHVLALSQKKYWAQFDKTPEFVILFMHGECFLAPALEHDPELLEFASAHKVLFATPTSLIALLKVIAFGWAEVHIEQHAQHIVHEAKIWLEHCETFATLFADVGKHMDKAKRSYETASASFENQLLPPLRKLSL